MRKDENIEESKTAKQENKSKQKQNMFKTWNYEKRKHKFLGRLEVEQIMSEKKQRKAINRCKEEIGTKEYRPSDKQCNTNQVF